MDLSLTFSCIAVAVTALVLLEIMRREVPRVLAPALVAAIAAALVFALGDALWRTATPGTRGHWLALLLMWAGVAAVPPAWWVLCLRFAEFHRVEPRWSNDKLRYAPAIAQAFCFGLLLTNPWHGWFLTPAPDRSEFHLLAWIHAGLTYATLAATIGVYAWLAQRAERADVRRQSRNLALGSAIPSLANAAYVLWPSPLATDPTMVAVAASTITLAFLITRRQLFSLSPIAFSEVRQRDTDAVMLLDSELRLLDANPVARKLLRGLLDEPADALVMLTKALVPRDGEVESCEALAARLARGVASPGELFELVSEPRRLLRITSLPICDSSGRVGSVLLRARDETELAEATARARERAALLEAVFDAAGFAVAVVDRAGRLRFANAATERLWGSSLADSLGESAQELLERATEVDPQGLARVRELFAARDAAARRVDLSLRDGRVVEVACVPMSEEGVVTQRLYLAADVTEQRHHETSAREAARLADLSQLAGGVAHGFNNLLSAVLGNVELIELTDPGNPRIRQFLREMRATVQRGAELSNQLLAYAGRAPLRRARIDLAELIEREAAELERQLPSVSLQRRIAQPLAPVFGDASQLAHVLGSLLRNAADALHPRGSAIAIEARDDAGRVEVRVKDDGAGMDEATLARAFDPFFSTKPKASGLSLSAARGIVSQHGGSLTAESALGQGSTFTLRLPRASEADFSAEPRASSTRSWRGSGRILVVDDEAPTLSVTRALAEALGFEAIAADRPSAALAAWRSVGGAVRVALIDAMMPECDGTELLRQLRLESPGLPAVIYSGFARESFELPAQPPTVFLQKPLSLQALSDALRRVLHEDVVSPAPGSAEASRPSRA